MVFLHFATKHAQTAKNQGKSPSLLKLLNSRPFTNAVVQKNATNARVEKSRATPIEPYTKIPVVLFSTPRSRKFIANSVKIAHAVREFLGSRKTQKKRAFFEKNEPPSNSDFRERATNMERAHPPETLNTTSTWAYSQNVAARRPQHRNKLNSIGICA